MRLRQRYAVADRVKLLLILFLVMIVMMMIAYETYTREQQLGKIATMERLLKNALQPVGSTMYIWGGGWDDEDGEAGSGATRIGLSLEWKNFAEKQDETYNFENYRYERTLGLDCSGYIGWLVYNTFETRSGQPGYVVTSTDMAVNFAGRGWGSLLINPETFLPGDIVSMDGHVWMSLGTCADGSVLLIHSSPPGVSICGTPVPKTEIEQESVAGDSVKTSIAISLAEKFMKEHYPVWQEKYSNRAVSQSYLNEVIVMRWNSSTLRGAETFQKMSGEQILEWLEDTQ